MSKAYAVLPCNGLDKCAGCVSREVALMLSEKSGSRVICPVFYRTAGTKYDDIISKMPLLVIDGCAVKCATKLASEKNLEVGKSINIIDEAKALDIKLGKDLRIGEQETKLVQSIVDELTSTNERSKDKTEILDLPELEYEIYKKEKFIFKVPTNEGFYFNENDVWAYVSGNKARIGVSDFIQQSLSDIMFFTPPAIGSEIEQFDEAGNIESGKAVFEITCPVSGTVTAVNEKLLESPELINQNPYEEGWIAELELTDFESDSDLLLRFDGYLPILKRKVDEFRDKN